MLFAAILYLILIVRNSVEDIRWYVYVSRKRKNRIAKRLKLEVTETEEPGGDMKQSWFPTEAEIDQAASIIEESDESTDREKWIMRYPSMKPRKREKYFYEKAKLWQVLLHIYRPVLAQRFAFMNTISAICCMSLAIVNFSVGAAGQFVVGPSHKFLLSICVALVWATLLTWAASNHGYFIIVKTLRRGPLAIRIVCREQ